MKPARNYVSAAAFRTALEVRLNKLAMEEGVDLQRVRRQVAFDRLLCWLFALPDAPWVLKGGYAMELRVKTARTTRDIDLALKQLLSLSASWEANAGTVLGMLREAAGTGSRDHFTFLIGEAVQDLDAAPYGGARFPVEARLAGRAFVKFHLDVSTGDVLREPYQLLRGRDWLGFAGIAAAQFPAISSEEQFAEKVHAYTLPREGRENSRVRDLVDLVLLVEQSHLDTVRLRNAIHETFQRRKTHEVPHALAPPPAWWSGPFAEMAQECHLEPKIENQFSKVEQFYRTIAL
ncbi:MAG: nucleotidyl transferase AbiEii/AbiGii toxin family protein [Verrucomicrobiia bacterium]|jgi:hypothetical protein